MKDFLKSTLLCSYQKTTCCGTTKAASQNFCRLHSYNWVEDTKKEISFLRTFFVLDIYSSVNDKINESNALL